MIKAVIFDYAGTIYNPYSSKLYPEVMDVLNFLAQKGLKLALISRSSNLEARLEEFRDLNLRKYFRILEAVPVENKKEFTHLLKGLNVKAEECLIVGDRVKSEILEGNKIGARTVWVLQGEFLDETPESELEKPDYTINSLGELLTIDQILQ
ncbi:HAD hydrolase-like protein [Candidatus Daviesbacteria bacterium]|nr:HAD hydrolase-like protein [Candidatus Daviesbacteria bacterium]